MAASLGQVGSANRGGSTRLSQQTEGAAHKRKAGMEQQNNARTVHSSDERRRVQVDMVEHRKGQRININA